VCDLVRARVTAEKDSVVLSADPAAELSAVAGADAAISPGAFATAVPEQARRNLQGAGIWGGAPDRSFGVLSYAQYLQAMAQQSVAPQQHFVSALLPPCGGRGGGRPAAGVTGSSDDLCCACTGCQRTAKMGCYGWRKYNQPSIMHEPRVRSWRSVLEESCRQVDVLTSGEWRETRGSVCQYTSVLGARKENFFHGCMEDV